MAKQHTWVTLKAKGGKTMEIHYYEESPDKIELILKNNRGGIKETFQFDAKVFAHDLGIFKLLYSAYNKEEENSN